MKKKSPFWHHVRLLAIQLLVGLALGVVVWELIGRRILALKYGSLGSSVTCSADVEQALAEFDSGLRLSALIGAILLVVLTLLVRYLLWRRKKRAKSAVEDTDKEKDADKEKEKDTDKEKKADKEKGTNEEKAEEAESPPPEIEPED